VFRCVTWPFVGSTYFQRRMTWALVGSTLQRRMTWVLVGSTTTLQRRVTWPKPSQHACEQTQAARRVRIQGQGRGVTIAKKKKGRGETHESHV
jgi:hypothetical protein